MVYRAVYNPPCSKGPYINFNIIPMSTYSSRACNSGLQVVGAMGACGGKAKRQGSREVLLNEGFRYSQLESR